MLASLFKRPEGSPKAVLLERGQGWQAQARPSPQVAMEGDAFLLAVARWHGGTMSTNLDSIWGMSE